MTAESYRDGLLKQWRLIILCMFLVAGGALLGSLFLPTLYQSTVTVQLIAPSTNLPLLAGADRILQTEVTLATSDPVLSQVVPRYQGLTTDQLKREVSAQTTDNTDLFQITISDRDPGRAAQLANDLAAVLIQQYSATIAATNAESQKPVLDSIAATQKDIDTTQANLNAAQASKPVDPQQVQSLQSQLSDLQRQYAQEQQTLASLQSAEAKAASFLHVTQAAQPGTDSAWLRRLFMNTAAGLCFGLLLGASFVLLRGRLDPRVRSVSALMELLGWPVLAEISAGASRSLGKRSREEQGPSTLIYQELDQNLAFLGIDTPLFSLMVTGASSGETANIVACDLAQFLAEEGKRVLLVDANFSQPSQSRLFDIPAEPGLGAAILASGRQNTGLSLQPYLYQVKGTPDRLRVLPAGPIPPNPEQVFKSKAARTVIGRLGATGADIVVLAGPPVAQSSGACPLAALVDGVIVVVDSPQTSKQKLARIKTRLAEHGARVLGCVVSSEPLNQPTRSQRIRSQPMPPEQHSLHGRV